MSQPFKLGNRVIVKSHPAQKNRPCVGTVIAIDSSDQKLTLIRVRWSDRSAVTYWDQELELVSSEPAQSAATPAPAGAEGRLSFTSQADLMAFLNTGDEATDRNHSSYIIACINACQGIDLTTPVDLAEVLHGIKRYLQDPHKAERHAYETTGGNVRADEALIEKIQVLTGEVLTKATM